MKVKYIVYFILVFIIGDMCIGIVSKHTIKNMKAGFYGSINKSINDTSSVFILGSSRAESHYNSNIIENCYKKSVFNAGKGGLGLICSYAILNERIKKHKPNLVILDIPTTLMTDKGQIEKLSLFRPLSGLYSTFEEIIKLDENYKPCMLYLQSYKYNSTLYDVSYSIYTNTNKSDSFLPLEGEITPQNHKFEFYSEEGLTPKQLGEIKQVYMLQMIYLDKIVKICNNNNIRLYCVISPSFLSYDKNNILIPDIKKHLDSLNIRLINFTDGTIFKSPQFFKDQHHLNVRGADLFTKVFCDTLAANAK